MWQVTRFSYTPIEYARDGKAESVYFYCTLRDDLDCHLEVKTGIVPVHIDDDTFSLSAILMDEDFYKFMMTGRRTVDRISILTADYIIPFKLYAWLNLTKKKSIGEHVNSKDLKKQKYDVFRLWAPGLLF